MPRNRKVPKIDDFERALQKIREIRVQRTCTDNGQDLYGFLELDRIGVAVKTCMTDGGPDLIVSTLIHELVHYIAPELDENEVEEVVNRHARSYKLKYLCALALINALAKKAGLV